MSAQFSQCYMSILAWVDYFVDLFKNYSVTIVSDSECDPRVDRLVEADPPTLRSPSIEHTPKQSFPTSEKPVIERFIVADMYAPCEVKTGIIS